MILAPGLNVFAQWVLQLEELYNVNWIMFALNYYLLFQIHTWLCFLCRNTSRLQHVDYAHDPWFAVIFRLAHGVHIADVSLFIPLTLQNCPINKDNIMNRKNASVTTHMNKVKEVCIHVCLALFLKLHYSVIILQIWNNPHVKKNHILHIEEGPRLSIFISAFILHGINIQTRL